MEYWGVSPTPAHRSFFSPSLHHSITPLLRLPLLPHVGCPKSCVSLGGGGGGHPAHSAFAPSSPHGVDPVQHGPLSETRAETIVEPHQDGKFPALDRAHAAAAADRAGVRR